MSFGVGAAHSGDWGYDGMDAHPAAPVPPKALEGQSAAPYTQSILKPKADKVLTPQKIGAPGTQSKASPGDPGSKTGVKAKTGTKTMSPPAVQRPGARENDLPGAASTGADAFIDKDQQAARCWLQLFQACSKQPLEYAQQKRMEAYMLQKARQSPKNSEELRSVMKFWPKMINDLQKQPEMEMHYADLFKALLRLHERTATEKTHVEGSEFSSDADLIGELLGLQRVAVAGDPAFTEDAVNAYADMAVFIYEQRHDGRTIDANDNRALFAKVVVEKFNRAPTDADQRAMASFDLAWAKFKIIWFSSDDKTKKVLLEKLEKTGANSTLTVAKDPLLDAVLSNWPWKVTP